MTTQTIFCLGNRFDYTDAELKINGVLQTAEKHESFCDFYQGAFVDGVFNQKILCDFYGITDNHTGDEVMIIETGQIVDLPRCGGGYNQQSTDPFDIGTNGEFYRLSHDELEACDGAYQYTCKEEDYNWWVDVMQQIDEGDDLLDELDSDTRVEFEFDGDLDGYLNAVKKFIESVKDND